MQALDKMDKAGAIGSASDRSKPVSWDGAALQVSTCCTLSAAEVVLPCGDISTDLCHGFMGSSTVLPAVCAPLDAALQPCSPQDVGCGVLMEFVWLQVNVGVNVFGRGETGTTTDQVCIECSLHRIAAAA